MNKEVMCNNCGTYNSVEVGKPMKNFPEFFMAKFICPECSTNNNLPIHLISLTDMANIGESYKGSEIKKSCEFLMKKVYNEELGREISRYYPCPVPWERSFSEKYKERQWHHNDKTFPLSDNAFYFVRMRGQRPVLEMFAERDLKKSPRLVNDKSL